MKKTIVSCLLMIFMGFLSIECLLLPNSEKVLGSIKEEENDIFIDTPTDYFQISETSKIEHVYQNALPLQSRINSLTTIEKCEINVDGNYSGGNIIPSNTTFNGITYNSRIRVNKYSNSTIYGDLLDKTYVSVTLLASQLPIDITTINLEARWMGKDVNICDYDIAYQSGMFKLTLNVENDGNIFSNQKVEVIASYKSIDLNGLLIKKDAVFKDATGNYIKQIVFFKKVQYFKKTYVEIVDDFSGYYKISSSEPLANVLVCY